MELISVRVLGASCLVTSVIDHWSFFSLFIKTLNENPYQSPEAQLPVARPRGVGLLRMMFSGLVVGTLVGLGAGAVAGAALFVALWLSTSVMYSSGDPLSMAEYGAMQVFRGVFTGALVGFVFVAPLGVVLGATAAIWRPPSKRPFLLLTTIVNVVLFAGVGVIIPQWPAPISALVTGAVGIGSGIMLGRVLAEIAVLEVARVRGGRH